MSEMLIVRIRVACGLGSGCARAAAGVRGGCQRLCSGADPVAVRFARAAAGEARAQSSHGSEREEG